MYSPPALEQSKTAVRFSSFGPCSVGPARQRIDLNRESTQTQAMKKELTFEIEQDDGGFVAVCHEPEMATQRDTLEELVAMIRDLVKCRFDKGNGHLGWPIRLHFVHDPVLADAAA